MIKLEGCHSSTVLAVEVTALPDVKIITGSDDGQLSITSPDGSVLHRLQLESHNEITSIASSQQDLFYVSSEDIVHTYDMRQLSSAVHSLAISDDDINQICVNNKDDYLAACSDSGNVRLIDLRNRRPYRTLRKHSNICATAVFRPDRPSELISAGYDSKIIQWDFSRIRSFCTISVDELNVHADDVASFLVNPPFIHHMSMSRNGGTVACAAENALVYLFDSSKRTLQFRRVLRQHSQGVSQVHFPAFGDNRYLISGGNDGLVCIWDMNRSLDVNGATTNGVHHQQNGTSDSSDSHNCLWRYQHSEKVNWISSGSTVNHNFFVLVDNSKSPLVISFPV